MFLSACRRQPVPYTPVWFMRQAGRSLPEYRAARRRTAMVEACTKPDLITALTLQPLRRYQVDAAILFSDIVVPLRAAGIGIDIRSGVGPVVEKPIRTETDLQRLRPLEPGDLPYVTKAVKTLVGELGATPLIGFAGGPFTLASYLVDGGPSKNFDKTKALMYGNPPLWNALLRRLADLTITFLRVQVDAGASAVRPASRMRTARCSMTSHGASSIAGSRLPCRALPGSTRRTASSSGTRQSTPTTSAPASPIMPSSSPVPTPKCSRGTPDPASASKTRLLCGSTDRR